MGDIINVSGLSIYTLGLVVVFCFLWGSFVFYKKAIEAHFEENMILDMVVLGAFWSLILGRAGFVLTHLSLFVKHWTRIFLFVTFPGIERWGVLLGLLLGAGFMIRKKKGKYLDYFDLAMLGYLAGAAMFWTGINFISFYWQNLVVASFYLLTFLWFWKIEKTYRFITWYRGSKTFAKSGFVTGFGICSIALAFLIELITYKNLGLGSVLFFTLLFIAGLVLVYIRSGRILADDIKVLKIWNKTNKK